MKVIQNQTIILELDEDEVDKMEYVVAVTKQKIECMEMTSFKSATLEFCNLLLEALGRGK